MVGIFSRFSGIRSGHRRTQSAIDGRQTVSANAETAASAVAAAAAVTHGIEVAVEFKPVEHPIEPIDNNQPIRCPLPEPSILNLERTSCGKQISSYQHTNYKSTTNDGRIWKERLSASVRRRADLPVLREGVNSEPEATAVTKPPRPHRSILPSSISAPEHDLIYMLEECKAAGDQTFLA